MKKLTAILLVLVLALSVAGVSVSAAQTSNQSSGATGITVHYYTEKGTPSVYYWNSLPSNISTDYPGPKMTRVTTTTSTPLTVLQRLTYSLLTVTEHRVQSLQETQTTVTMSFGTKTAVGSTRFQLMQM